MNGYKFFLDKLLWRYAVKKFDPAKKLSSDQIEFIKESLRLAPSSFGLQPWRFYIVENPETRAKIRELAGDQSKVTEASHLFILASRVNISPSDIEEYAKEIASVRGLSESQVKDFKKGMLEFIAKKSPEWLDNWCSRQLYIALGFGLMAAAENGIDACPMEGFDADAVTALIGANNDGYAVKAMFAAGFRSPEDPYTSLKKVRFPKEKVIKII